MKELTFLIVALISIYIGYLFSRPKEINIISKEFVDPVKEIEDELPTQPRTSGCMLGCSPCYPLCAGEGNPCGLVAPIPSPMWQPQSASTVAKRLREGNYTKNYCY